VPAAARVDRDDADRITLATAEAELSGRLDLAHMIRRSAAASSRCRPAVA
jgi:hypothetical protein